MCYHIVLTYTVCSQTRRDSNVITNALQWLHSSKIAKVMKTLWGVSVFYTRFKTGIVVGRYCLYMSCMDEYTRIAVILY